MHGVHIGKGPENGEREEGRTGAILSGGYGGGWGDNGGCGRQGKWIERIRCCDP